MPILKLQSSKQLLVIKGYLLGLCKLLTANTCRRVVAHALVELTLTSVHLLCICNRYFTVKENIREFTPVDTDSVIPKLLILLMYSW